MKGDAVQARKQQESLNEQLNESLIQVQEKGDSLTVAFTGLEAEKNRSESLAKAEKQQAMLAKIKSEELSLSLKDLAIEKLRSDSLREVAQGQTARANRALEEALTSLLREAEGHLYTLNYEKAQEALLSAAKLGVEPRKAGATLMEMAYFRTESHRYREGLQLTQEVARLYNEALLPEPIPREDSLKILRAALISLDRDRYESLEARYYPLMIPIDGGAFMMGCDPKVDTICGKAEYYADNENQHTATVSDFKMAATETTLWQFSLYCEAEGKDVNQFINAGWGVAGDRPTISVNWYDALEYANWASIQQGRDSVYTIDKLNKDSLNLSDFDSKKMDDYG